MTNSTKNTTSIRTRFVASPSGARYEPVGAVGVVQKSQASAYCLSVIVDLWPATQVTPVTPDVDASFANPQRGRRTLRAITQVPQSIPDIRVGRIVVGVDGSPASLVALTRASALADSLRASLEVLTSWRYQSGYAYFGSVEWSPERDAEQIVADAAVSTFGSELPRWVSTKVIQGGAAQTLIAASEGADMLVVGSRGHGGMAGLLLGSVSAACAERASCPVLVVH